METIYSERANGRREYYTYCDGARVYVSAAYVARELKRGRVRLVAV